MTNLAPPSAEEETRADDRETARLAALLDVAHAWCPACGGQGDVIGPDGGRSDCPHVEIHHLISTAEVQP